MEGSDNTVMGICGACGVAVLSASIDGKLKGWYGNKCNRHHLIFCKECCTTSSLVVPCRDCAHQAAKGSLDPALRSVGRYTPTTLESGISSTISYINYGRSPGGSNRHHDLIQRIELMSCYKNVSNPLFNTCHWLKISHFSDTSHILLR